MTVLSASKLRDVLSRYCARAVGTFDMFSPGDKVIIGLSGGADSLVLVDIINRLVERWRRMREISFTAVMIDPGFSTISPEKICGINDFCESRGMKFLLVEKHQISQTVQNPSHPFPPCFTCSRMRRKSLLETARDLGATKVALAHHRDDLLETFFLNIFFSRQISSFVPKQELFKGMFYIVRPLVLVDERKIKEYARLRSFPVIEKICPYAGNTKRLFVKRVIENLEKEQPGIKDSIFRSLFRVRRDYLWEEYLPLIGKLAK